MSVFKIDAPLVERMKACGFSEPDHRPAGKDQSVQTGRVSSNGSAQVWNKSSFQIRSQPDRKPSTPLEHCFLQCIQNGMASLRIGSLESVRSAEEAQRIIPPCLRKGPPFPEKLLEIGGPDRIEPNGVVKT
jgi:hypothetical protein